MSQLRRVLEGYIVKSIIFVTLISQCLSRIQLSLSIIINHILRAYVMSCLVAKEQSKVENG